MMVYDCFSSSFEENETSSVNSKIDGSLSNKKLQPIYYVHGSVVSRFIDATFFTRVPCPARNLPKEILSRGHCRNAITRWSDIKCSIDLVSLEPPIWKIDLDSPDRRMHRYGAICFLELPRWMLRMDKNPSAGIARESCSQFTWNIGSSTNWGVFQVGGISRCPSFSHRRFEIYR